MSPGNKPLYTGLVLSSSSSSAGKISTPHGNGYFCIFVLRLICSLTEITAQLALPDLRQHTPRKSLFGGWLVIEPPPVMRVWRCFQLSLFAASYNPLSHLCVCSVCPTMYVCPDHCRSYPMESLSHHHQETQHTTRAHPHTHVSF